MSLHKNIKEGFNIPPKVYPPSLYYTGYSQGTQKELCSIMHLIEHEIDNFKPYYQREYIQLPNGNFLLIRSYSEY
jgi:hypothetical protein